jgi:hypothetical protein
MSLDQLQGDTTQNFIPMNPNDPSVFRRLDRPLGMLQPSPPSVGPYPPSGIASVGGQLPSLTSIISGPGFNRPMPLPVRPPGFGNFIGIQPPMLQPAMPDYSGQFEKLGEQLGGFGKQLDALGSFNEQVGGLGKQFEAVNNKLDSLEKGLGSLGNQLASIEQGQPKPQEVQQPQQPSYSPFGFGGLANLFMNMRRF